MPDPAPGKICVVCKQDCSDRPRTKDRQGRYFCKPCYENVIAQQRAKASRPARPAKPAPPPAMKPEASMLAELADQASPPPVEGSTPCPSCGQPIAPDAALCVECGYNVRSGRKLKVRKSTERAPREGPGAGAMLLQPMAVAAGAMVIYGILFAVGLSMGGPEAVTIMAAWHVPFSFGVGIFILVLAFMESIVQGILTLCVPCYAIYFVYGVCENGYAKWLFLVAIIGGGLYGGLIGALGVNPMMLPS